ncbi:anti-sigma factor family protein [Streptomyces lydicamycinicus]|uniref:anti-sigma factor family protein n=1 Tax=Streptomyces lydicamycinicus TaxID=1546107 RepID=UPI0032DE7B28
MSGNGGPSPAEQHLGDRLAALVDGELGHDARERVLAHLATCGKCKAEADAQRRLKNVFAQAAPPGRPRACWHVSSSCPAATPRVPAAGSATAPSDAVTSPEAAARSAMSPPTVTPATPWRRFPPLARPRLPGP